MTASSEEPSAAQAILRPRWWLERIKVNRFRSVEPGTELWFSEGLHVVLGKNASGKSTLLDLIAACLAVNFDHPTFHDEPLDLEFTLKAGELRFEAKIKRALRDPSASAMSGDIEGRGRSLCEEGRYILHAPSGFEITVVLSSDDIPRRTIEGGDPAQYGLDEPLGWRHQLAPLAPSLDGLANLWLQGSLDAWRTLLGRGEDLAGVHDRPFRMPEGNELLNEFDEDDPDSNFMIYLGESLRSQPYLLPDGIFKALSPTGTGSAIEVPLAMEPVLFAFIRELGFSEARMSLGPPRVERLSGNDVFAYSSPAFTFYRDGRLVRRVDQLSYGQRRLFALGWYLTCTRDSAILDEPANGLHESWIAFLISQLHDRQVFLTSQNRELLDMLPFSTETELSRGFVLCESRPQPGGGEPTLHWRGLREDESALMIKALGASRVDLITDLLRALDLW
jgi:energy-coupling factor transporter ATP-binding protein EcfA2